MLKKQLNLRWGFKPLMLLSIATVVISAEMPQWIGDPVVLKANGVDIKATYTAKDPNFVPALADWDNDGDLDLLVAADNYPASYDGQAGTEPRVFLYENIGDSKNHQFKEKVRIGGLSRNAFVPRPAG